MNISDLFSNLNYNNYSQIKQNPTSVVRTPIQEAYDNLLNREYEINKQNKTNNLVNGLMSGMGGLGKIIASSVVKNPMQQYGAMKGLTEQEGRIDNLQQAYNQARQKQNQDYVQQAKEQLGLATAEDERNYNREQTALDRAYKKAIDDRNWTNTLEQQDIANKLNQDKLDFAKEQAAQNQKNADREYNLKLSSINSKSADLTPEEKLAWKIKEEDAIANAKAKRDAQQDLNKAIAGQQAFENNIKHLEDLSKKSGTVVNRAIGDFAGLFTGKDTSLTRANNAMDELVSQVRQAALTASGISGESDDKAQQAKLKDIYERAGVPMNAKSLTQAQVGSIINNIKNIYKQRVAEKQSLLDSFNENNENQDNNFSVSWGN